MRSASYLLSERIPQMIDTWKKCIIWGSVYTGCAVPFFLLFLFILSSQQHYKYNAMSFKLISGSTFAFILKK